MRFVWAVAAFILAAVMIGAGISQRTIFQGPETQTAAISAEREAPYLLIEGTVLNEYPGAQTLRAQGEGQAGRRGNSHERRGSEEGGCKPGTHGAR